MKYSLVCLFFFVSLFSPQRMFAQQIGTGAAMLATPTPEVVEYQLPYPGILPDNPLYFLKVLRDRIVGFLIADPLKKAEFNLLQADKRLQAGVYLTKGKKYDLALSTISKAQNYMEEAFNMLQASRQQGRQTQDLARKILTATKRHLDVLEEIEQALTGKDRQRFSGLTKRAQKIEKTAEKLSLQK